jgi:hypothetical protein
VNAFIGESSLVGFCLTNANYPIRYILMSRYIGCNNLDTKIAEKRYFESRHEKPTPKDDFEERFPGEIALLVGCSCAVPVCYGRAEGTDTRPNAPRCPTVGSSASTESFCEV